MIFIFGRKISYVNYILLYLLLQYVDVLSVIDTSLKIRMNGVNLTQKNELLRLRLTNGSPASKHFVLCIKQNAQAKSSRSEERF